MKRDCMENKRLRLLLLEADLSGDEKGADSIQVSRDRTGC